MILYIYFNWLFYCLLLSMAINMIFSNVILAVLDIFLFFNWVYCSTPSSSRFLVSVYQSILLDSIKQIFGKIAY